MQATVRHADVREHDPRVGEWEGAGASMRREPLRAGAIAIVAAACAPIAAHARSATACYEWAGTTSVTPQSFYPPAALAEHLEGSAVLKCSRNERDGMTNCQVISEKPAGQGFGSAALALAARSKEATGSTIAQSQRRPRRVTFEFHANSPCITPNVIGLPWLPIAPVFEHYPDIFQLARARADARVDTAHGGSAVLSCKVAISGRLTDCGIVDEKPKDGGFGKAALLLSQNMAVGVTTRDGVSIVGQTLTFGVPFDSPSRLGRQ